MLKFSRMLFYISILFVIILIISLEFIKIDQKYLIEGSFRQEAGISTFRFQFLETETPTFQIQNRIKLTDINGKLVAKGVIITRKKLNYKINQGDIIEYQAKLKDLPRTQLNGKSGSFYITAGATKSLLTYFLDKYIISF